MREALLVMFEAPGRSSPASWAASSATSLSLLLIGVVLVVSVAVSGFVSTSPREVLDWIGVGAELAPLLVLVTVVIGLAANMVLFFALFRLLADARRPDPVAVVRRAARRPRLRGPQAALVAAARGHQEPARPSRRSASR